MFSCAVCSVLACCAARREEWGGSVPERGWALGDAQLGGAKRTCTWARPLSCAERWALSARS